MDVISLIIPAFVAGFLTFLAPCTLPMVPAYLGFISGTSAQEAIGESTLRLRYRIFTNGLAFVLGFSSIFILFGVFAGFLGQLIPDFRAHLSTIGGVFVIVFGLFMLGVLRIPAFSREYRLQVHSPFVRGSHANAFALGAAFGTGWTPCIGPILGSILTLAATSSSALDGAFLLAVYALGLSVPFLLAAFALGTAEKTIARITPYLTWISRASGALLIVLGLFLATNSMPTLVAFMYRYVPFDHYDSLLKYF